MDTPTQPYQPTHISLCSGYGGIDLGLKRVLTNLRTVAYAEVECAAIELLLARMEGGSLDPAPIWSDLRSFPWEAFSNRVDILSGGYPCQPFSAAGKRLGTSDERHLWPFIADGVRILRPKVCFFENVEGHITLGLSTVVSDLEELGYEVSWGLFSAAEVGAPHQRKRVFIVAYRCGEGLEGREWLRQAGAQGESSGHFAECRDDLWPSRPGEPQQWWEPPRVVGDTQNGRRRRLDDESSETSRWQARGHVDGTSTSEQQEQRKTEPKVGGDVTRTTSGMGYGELCRASDNRTDELRMLGNGVVASTAARAFLTLIQAKHES